MFGQISPPISLCVQFLLAFDLKKTLSFMNLDKFHQPTPPTTPPPTFRPWCVVLDHVSIIPVSFSQRCVFRSDRPSISTYNG